MNILNTEYKQFMFEDDEEAEMDLEALKSEMFEDFESEKAKLQSSTNRMTSPQNNITTESSSTDNETAEEEDNNEYEDETQKISFAVEQFQKRIEFNEALKTASKVKSTRSVSHKSAALSQGIPEILYDAEGTDQYVTYMRLYTYTPLTMGCLFVPLAIYSFPEWELFPKLLLGAFYMGTSAIFPWCSYRAVRDKVNRAWLTPDCNKVIIEKIGFFFQPYKQEYFIKDLRVLHKKGSARHCWFQCHKTKTTFLFISELMQHPVWLQLLGVDEDQVADATLRNIANDGKVTMFRGPNT